MNLTELLLCNLTRGATHQILCISVHRERNNLTNIFFITKEHDHTINTGSHTGMWWCTELECIVKCSKLCLQIFFCVSCDLKCFYHDLHIVISDSTG